MAAYALPLPSDGFRGAGSTEAEALAALQGRPHWRKAFFYLWDEPKCQAQYAQLRARVGNNNNNNSESCSIRTNRTVGSSQV